MSPAILTAIAALAAHVVAAAAGRRALSFVAVALSAVAIGFRGAGVGAAVIGLAVAAGLGIAAADIKPRALHALAAMFCLPAAAFAAAAQPAGAMWSIGAALAAAIVAFVVAAAAVDCVGRSRAFRAAVAAVIAAAPMPLLIASPLAGMAEVPLGVEPMAWLQRGGLQLDPALGSGWSVQLWSALPWLGLLAVAIGWQARDRRIGLSVWGLWCVAAAAAAAGQADIVSSWLDGTSSSLLAESTAFPLAARGIGADRMVDGSAALLLVARQAAVLALLFATVPTGEPSSPRASLFDTGALVSAIALLAVWAVFAPHWVGVHWLADPAAGAVIAAIAATIGVCAWRHDAAAAWLRAAQLGAAALILGGADLGWRVASALMVG